MTIFIGNLSFDSEQEDITGLISSYGEIKTCKIPIDSDMGRKRGFPFVDMTNEEDEKEAIDDLQKKLEPMGHSIRVNKTEPRRDSRGGGGNHWQPK